ncbi:MAG: amino acid adenylation domain-containing protein [Gammaproteobacteria bacterium]|nr:amino acid adenylation domain-containing protein [Gammaproteobacteria bacterium]
MKTDGFNQESINQFKQHLIAMIDFACDRPQEQLSALTLSQPFTPDLEFFVEKTRIEEKFDEIAKHFSSQVAFQNADEQTSYAELSKMVHCIAANLAPQTKAIQNFPVVGLSMHHGPELIATMLALFKLGLTYLPIRPDLPPSYIKEIIDQSGLKLIISNNSVSGSLNSGVQILYVEDLLKESKGSFSKIMLENKNKNELAYILYTSGTMGTPKGVMVKHSNITNLISSCQSFYNFSSQDIIPWFHSYAFDFSVWEIWAALLNGATVLLVDEFVAKSPREFTAYIAKYQATFINQTPTALKQWLTYLAAKTDALPDLSKVRVILTGGEALYPHHVSLLLSKKTPLQCKIFNMYGITEDTVHSTIFEVTASYLDQNKSVIGKMLPGKNALIVDRANLIRPVGCPGELVISGFGVANGYLHQVDLTNCKFTQIPEVSPEVVWFKTGDQVRLLPSGHFEYLGREDAQIKIRGYRIDYKDVEARLARLEGVVDVKVVPSDDALIAFLILSPDAVIADIQILAKATLPYYMMPGQFCSVGSIPQTINNKVDEKKLLEITRQSSIVKAGSAEYIDNPVMQKIVEIWHAILPESSFEIEDNFFDCGGNSILLISLQEKLEKTFSIELPIVEFFIHPNVESMTTVVERLISQK